MENKTVIKDIRLGDMGANGIIKFEENGESVHWYVKADDLLELLRSTFKGEITK